MSSLRGFLSTSSQFNRSVRDGGRGRGYRYKFGTSISPKQNQIRNIPFSDNSQGKMCQNFWDEYYQQSSIGDSDSGDDSECFEYFKAFAATFIATNDVRDNNYLETIIGHPTIVVEHVLQLFLKGVTVMISNNRDKTTHEIDALTWLLDPNHPESILDEVAKGYVNESYFLIDKSDVPYRLSEKSLHYLRVIHVTAILLRFQHNQSIVIARYGLGFARIVMDMIHTLSERINDIVLQWSDMSADVLISEETVLLTEFTLSCVLAMVHIYASDGATVTRSEFQSMNISQPFTLHFLKEFLSVCPTDVVDLSIKRFELVNVEEPLSPQSSESLSMGFLEQFIGHNSTSVFSMLLRRLVYLSSSCLSRQKLANNEVYLSFTDNDKLTLLWRSCMVLQCEVLMAFSKILRCSSVEFIQQYIECSGWYALQQLLSMADIPALSKREDIIIVGLRLILCIQFNMKVIDSMSTASIEVPATLSCIQQADAFAPSLTYLMSIAVDDVMIPNIQKDLDIEFVSPTVIPDIGTSHVLDNDQGTESNLTLSELRVKCYHNFYATNYYRQRYIKSVTKSVDSLNSFGVNDKQDIFVNDIVGEIISKFFLTIYSFSVKDIDKASITNTGRDDFLSRILTIISEKYSELPENNIAPVFQFHFLNFLEKMRHRHSRYMQGIIRRGQLLIFLASSCHFLSSGHRKLNNLMKYNRRRIRFVNIEGNITETEDAWYRVSIEAIKYGTEDSMSASTSRRYYALHYKYIHDMVLDLIYSSISDTIVNQGLDQYDSFFSHSIELCARLLSVSSPHDIIIQICRLLIRILHVVSEKNFRSKVWAAVMLEASNVCRQHVYLINPTDALTTYFDHSPLLWPARVSILHLMQLIASKTECRGWVKGFFIGLNSSTISKQISSGSKMSDGIHFNTAIDQPSLQRGTTDLMSVFVPDGFSHVAIHRHFAVLRLVLYKRCRSVALYIVRQIFRECANIVFGPTASLSEIDERFADTKVSENDSLRKRSLMSSAEALAHDIIRVCLNVVRVSSRQPEVYESQMTAKLILKNLTLAISNSVNNTDRTSCWRVFESFGPMTSSHREFSWKHAYGNIYVELCQSLSDCVKYSKSLWSDEMKQEMLHVVLGFIKALLASNDIGKKFFTQVVFSNSSYLQLPLSSPPLSSPFSPKSDGKLGNSQRFEDFIKLILWIESKPSLDTIIILLETVFDDIMSLKSLHSLSNLDNFDNIDFSEIFQGELLTLANMSMISLLFRLVPYCTDNIQSLTFLVFLHLTDPDKSLVNLLKCTRMDPPLLELLLEIYPYVSVSSYPYIIRLLQMIGQYTLTVTQLKNIFNLLNSFPERSSVLLQSLKGMIRKDEGPYSFLYFLGEQSSLILPSLQKWPAVNGYAISLWFSVDIYQQSSLTSSTDEAPLRRRSSIRTSQRGHGQLMYVISMRQNTGTGFDVALFLDYDASVRSSFKLILRFKTYNAKEVLGDIQLPIPSSSFSSRNVANKTDNWHHLLISHAPATYVKKASVTIFIDGQLSRHLLSYPKFSDGIEYPIIGDCNPIFKDENQHINFKGKLGSIYFFSDIVSDDYALGIFNLGPRYGHIFNDRENTSVLTANHDVTEQFVHKALNGTLTSSIMLAYNPGVWKDKYLMDITPEKNTNRWKVINKKSGSLGKLHMYTGMWDEPNALRSKGTYGFTATDMRDSFDSLGGVKILLPLLSQMDKSNGVDYDTCAEVLELIFDILRNTPINQSFMSDNGIEVISHVLEKTHADHMTEQTLRILIDVCRRFERDRDVKAVLGVWETEIIKHILGNFRLWVLSEYSVQSLLFDHLLALTANSASIIMNAIPSQRLFDALSGIYRTTSMNVASDEKYDGSLNARPGSLLEYHDDNVYVSKSRSLTIADIPCVRLSTQQIDDIRSKIFQLIYTLLSSSSDIYDTVLKQTYLYIHNEVNPKYKLDGIQFFLRLISSSKPMFVDRFLLSALGYNALTTVIKLHENRDWKVRVYGVICFCSIFHLIICRGRLTQQSEVDAALLGSGDRKEINAINDKQGDRSSENDIPSVAYPVSREIPSDKGDVEKLSKLSKGDVDSLTFFGLSVKHLIAYFERLFVLFKMSISESESLRSIEIQLELIFQVYQLTMHGLPCKSLIAIVEKLSDSETNLESNSINMSRYSRFYRSSDVDIESQNIGSMKICIASIFPLLIQIIRYHRISERCKIRFLLELKTSLQAFDNIEMLFTVNHWQSYLFDLLSDEQVTISAAEGRLNTKGWNGNLENPKFPGQTSMADVEADLQIISNCKEIFEVVIHILSDVHLHGIRYCHPTIELSISRPSEISVSKINKLSTRDLLEFFSKSRRLGALLLEDTINVLRGYGERSEFDVRQTGLTLLLKTVEGIRKERDQLVNNLLESADMKEVRKKLFELNLWVITYIVAEFIIIQPLQQAKFTNRSSVQVKPMAATFIDEAYALRINPPMSSPILSSPITRPVSKLYLTADKVHVENDSSTDDMHDDLVSDVSLESERTDEDGGKLYHESLNDSAMPTSVNSKRNDSRGSRSDHSGKSARAISPSIDQSALSDTTEMLDIYSKWKLVDSLLEVIDLTDDGVYDSTMDRLRLGSKIGLLLGMQIINQMNEAMTSILPDDRSNTSRISSFPLTRAVQSVGKVVIRLLLRLYTKGSELPNMIEESAPYVKAVIRLNNALNSLKDKNPSLYESEGANAICRISLAMEESRQSPVSSWTEEGIKTIFAILPNLKQSFIPLLRKDPILSPKIDMSSKLSTNSETRRSSKHASKGSMSDAIKVINSVDCFYQERSSFSELSTSMLGLDAIRVSLGLTETFQMTWSQWKQAISPIIEESDRSEAHFLNMKTTPLGIHKQSQDVASRILSFKLEQRKYAERTFLQIAENLSRIEFTELKRQRDSSRQDDMNRKKCYTIWNRLLDDVAGERRPWGPGTSNESRFWILDPHEDSGRMRVLFQYSQFGRGLAFNPAFDNIPRLSSKTKTTTLEAPLRRGSDTSDISNRRDSTESSNYSLLSDYSHTDVVLKTSSEQIKGKNISDKVEIVKDLLKYQRNSNDMKLISDTNDVNDEYGNDETDEIDQGDDHGVRRDSDTASESNFDTSSSSPNKFLFKQKCELITPTTYSTNQRAMGMIIVTKSHITFIRDQQLESNMIQSPSKHRNSLIAKNAGNTNIRENHWTIGFLPSLQWETNDICDIFHRYYQLRFVAVEVFFTSRLSIFINFFDKAIAYKFQQLIRIRVKPRLLGPWIGIKPFKIMMNLSISTETGMENITTAWIHRRISNFDYLMKLNSIAGRTYNDLGQYPIFPWVLADYSSTELNLNISSTFRDLRYPIGAQTKTQRDIVRSRYHDLSIAYEGMKGPIDINCMPPFHFGTHYSVAGFIIWYLIRCEPFSSFHFQLQDGKFDKADRLFDSLESTYKSCTTNLSDVKELIPELYYLPECLSNENQLDLGITQNGHRVRDVKLPPWANESPHEFIRLHRDALESEYVSKNLHHWIDLIFGYKQRPPHVVDGDTSCVDACNVFYYLVYADAVDLDKLKANDPSVHDQFICQISEYGQSPAQLFKKPHPERLPFSEIDYVWPLASILRGVDTIWNPTEVPAKPRCMLSFHIQPNVSVFPIVFIGELLEADKQLITIDTSRIVGYHSWQPLQPIALPPFKFKIDSISLNMSKGQSSQSMMSRLTVPGVYNNTKNTKERKLGTPFAPPLKNRSNRITQGRSSLSPDLTWKPIKVSLYEKNERKDKESKKSQGPLIDSNSTWTTTMNSNIHTITQVELTRSHSDYSVPEVNNQNYTPDINLQNKTDDAQSINDQARRRSLSDSFKLSNQPQSNKLDAVSALESVDGSRPLQSPTETQGRARSVSDSYTSVNLPDVKDEHVSSNLFVLIPELRYLFSVGHWDHSLRVTSVDSGKLVQSVICHSGVVCCLATAHDYDNYYLASGSRDCTVMVWTNIQTGKEDPLGQPHVLYGHDDTVNCIAINAQLNIIISGSNDGTIIVHSLRDFVYIRSILDNGHRSVSRSLFTSDNDSAHSISKYRNDVISSVKRPITWVTISKERYILTYTSSDRRLTTYSINGHYLASKIIQERLHAFLLSDDGTILITGGEGCVVVFRWVHSLELACDGPRGGFEAVINGGESSQSTTGIFTCPIRSLHLTKYERHLIVGLESGEIRILALDSEYIRERLQTKLIEIGIL